MSKQRIIKDEIWDDEWFYDLDPSEKLVWIFLLTNPRNNIAGVYQLNRRWGAVTVGFDRDVFDVILKRFEKEKKIKTADEWLCIQKYHKHQSINPKVEAGVARIIGSLPNEAVKLLPMDSLCIAYPTLLNLTLPNARTAEGEEIQNMPFNKYADDYLEGDLQIDPDHKPKTKKKEKKVSDDVKAVFDLFNNPASALWGLREIERVAAQALFDTYGLEKLTARMKRIEAEKQKKDPYFPEVNTPSQLLDKMPNVERYLNI